MQYLSTWCDFANARDISHARRVTYTLPRLVRCCECRDDGRNRGRPAAPPRLGGATAGTALCHERVRTAVVPG